MMASQSAAVARAMVGWRWRWPPQVQRGVARALGLRGGAAAELDELWNAEVGTVVLKIEVERGRVI